MLSAILIAIIIYVLIFNGMNIRINEHSNISFGYSSKLKTYYKSGKLPSVKYGFYGDKLTLKNVSLEHLLPHSKGGTTTLDNLVLASKENNMKRGNEDIKKYLNADNLKRYVSQFIGVKLKDFDGNKYVSDILRTINKLLDS